MISNPCKGCTTPILQYNPDFPGYGESICQTLDCYDYHLYTIQQQTMHWVVEDLRRRASEYNPKTVYESDEVNEMTAIRLEEIANEYEEAE